MSSSPDATRDPTQLRPGTPDDVDAMRALFPRLASFEVPAARNPAHLYEGDIALLEAWGRGERDDCFAVVAVDDDALLGCALVSLREEMLSHEPSGHLEVLVVAEGAEGRGVGAALLDGAEREARARGARSMTLHVFANNTRARRVYERAGYDGEILRYFKPFET